MILSLPLKSSSPALYGGIFFLSCGTLIFELSLIRLFSVAHEYHFAFLVVSIAMLGLGAAGSLLAIVSKWLVQVSLTHLSRLSFGFGLAVIAAYLLANYVPFDQLKIAFDNRQFLYLLLYYFLLAIPPFFTGLVLSAVYANYSQDIGKLYFYDIIGAALGALAVLKLTSLANGLGGIWAAAICGLLSSVFFMPSFSKSILKVLIVFLVALISYLKPSLFSLNLSEYKALKQLLRPSDAKILYKEWTPVARLDFVKSPMVHFAPGLSLRSYARLPEQLGVVVDGGQLSAVTGFHSNPASLTFIDHLPASLPYHLSPISTVLICEPLGGLDILTALYFRASEIYGVGIHNQIAAIASEKFDGFSGSLFTHPSVRLYTMAARAYLQRTAKKYDLISLPISDVFGAASTGIYGPSEDYLFTVEAFSESLQHLSNSGWLVASCYILPPLRQELRLMSLAVAALTRDGKNNPEEHLISIRTLETFSILAKASPIDQREVDILKTFCEERGFDMVYYPGIETRELNRFNRFEKPIFHEALKAILNDTTRQRYYQNYDFDVRPTTDDRPFFGHFFRRDKLRAEYDSLGRRWTTFFEGGYLVAALFMQACLLSLLLIVLPIAVVKKRLSSSRVKIKSPFIVGYFFNIGLAYMLIEIVLIQRSIMILEHPLYAASAVIASLLISSACGSFISRRVEKAVPPWSIGKHLLVLCVVLVIYLWFLPKILSTGMSHGLIPRYWLTMCLVAIPGFLMGFAFPVGIRALGQRNAQIIPWAYCANGTASVISGALAVLIALEWGFRWAMIVAIAFYFLAAIAGSSWIRKGVKPSQLLTE